EKSTGLLRVNPASCSASPSLSSTLHAVPGGLNMRCAARLQRAKNSANDLHNTSRLDYSYLDIGHVPILMILARDSRVTAMVRV
ncbi:hypothetical protein R0J93_22865, partial [Pseudoalteromonas sp. SIMBA_148]